MGKFGSAEPPTPQFFGDNGGDENNSNIINEQETKIINNQTIKTYNIMAVATPAATPLKSSYITKVEMTPFLPTGVVGTDKFVCNAIIEGLSYAEADATFTDTKLESSDDIFHRAATLGDKTLTFNVGDLQAFYLEKYFGATVDTESGEILMPNSAQAIYAKIDMFFKEGFEKMTFYKTTLTATIVGDALKTGVLQAKLTFTAMKDNDGKGVGLTPRKVSTPE